MDNILGRWNTYELNGKQTLRLTATDAGGNKSAATATVDLDQRKRLIKDLVAIPGTFSPNNDGKFDTTTVKYELSDACAVKIEITNSTAAVEKTHTTTVAPAGVHTYTWDGRNNSGGLVSDGV